MSKSMDHVIKIQNGLREEEAHVSVHSGWGCGNDTRVSLELAASFVRSDFVSLEALEILVDQMKSIREGLGLDDKTQTNQG